MSFFDRKEDVLAIELTRHGKEKLRKGEFKPKFYTFHDDDVLYDGAYAGNAETQSDIEERVFDSLRIAPQMSIIGADRAALAAEHYEDDLFQVVQPLGTCRSNSLYMPAWSVKTHMGTFLSASGAMTGSLFSASVPQLDYEVEWKTKIGKRQPAEGENLLGPGHEVEGEFDAEALFDLEAASFPDGSYIKIEGEPLLIEISEENVDFFKENFDLEFYMVDEGPAPPRLIRLDAKIEEDFAEPSLSDVQYFMEVRVDSEIDDRFLCKTEPQGNEGNIFLPNERDCSDVSPFQTEEGPIYPRNPEDDGEGIC